MREITGLNVLGTVSMTWTDAEKLKRRRGQYMFGMSFACLLCAYAAVLAAGVLKP
jgi:hypothetical protein